MGKPEANLNSISRISVGTHFKGDLVSEGDLRVDGNFSGNLSTRGRIVVGETAVISGHMACGNADIWGKFDGEIFVKDILTLKPGSVLKGKIAASRLAIELGAVFEGECRTITKEEFDSNCQTLPENPSKKSK